MLTGRRSGGDATYIDAVDEDPPGRRSLEAADHPQRGRLAAARRPEEREELTREDVEIDAVDRDLITEALLEPDQADGAADCLGHPAGG